MNRQSRPTTGQGFSHSNEHGKFEVRYNETRTFNRLSEARAYYESLCGEKAIWDVTYGAELIECCQ